MKFFLNAATKEKADGCTYVLLMDGHSSHYTLELLEFAQVNNIIILKYPPLHTHLTGARCCLLHENEKGVS